MARKVELEIVIHPDGTVRVHVKGAKGRKCLEYMTAVEAILGKADHHELTSEYYEQEVRTETDIRQRSG